MIRARGGAAPPLLIAAAIGVAMFGWLSPGIVTYDGMSQYGQAIGRHYDDWHPPVMAALWSLSIRAGWPGSAPMLALQSVLFWGGLGLTAAALWRAGRRGPAVVALLSGLMPVVASWMGCVLKDAQLLGAMAAATGGVAWYRLAGRRMPWWAVLLVAAALAYAVLLRANAAFAAVPLALGLAGWGGARRLPLRAGLLLATTGAVILVSGPINHRLLGADRSHVERTLPVFDMAGIAHRSHLATLPGLPPAIWRHAEAMHCYTPFYWDPLGDATRCAPVATTLAFDRDEDAPSIWGQWAGLVAAHPLAWAGHRLAHLNDTLRIAVPADERLAVAPAASIANSYGIGLPSRPAAARLARIAAMTAETPAGVPAVWLVLACGLWWTLAAARAQPARAIGLALAASAVLMTASFAIVSIASDLRYHLWLIEATMLAAAMLWACDGIDRRRLRVTAMATAAACLASVALRCGMLPVAAIPA